MFDALTLTWVSLAIIRLAPFLLIAPWLEPLPRSMRAPLLLMVGGFALLIPDGAGPVRLDAWLVAAATELLVGSSMALTFALPYYSFRWIGDVAESLRGAPRTQMPGAQGDTALSFFFHLATLAMFAAAGGLSHTIEAFFRFSKQHPLGGFESSGLVLEPVLHLLGDTFALSIQVALPLLAVAFLLELTLALAARTAPQIPIFFLALPVRSLAVISAAAIGLGSILWMAEDALALSLVSP